jgi:hypothetical protein
MQRRVQKKIFGEYGKKNIRRTRKKNIRRIPKKIFGNTKQNIRSIKKKADTVSISKLTLGQAFEALM